MPHSWCALVAALALGLVARATARAPIAGTYALRLCKADRPCVATDSAAVLVHGYVVLSDSLGFGRLPKGLHSRFRRFGAAGVVPSGCYALERGPGWAELHTLAGVSAARWFRWTPTGEAGGVEFALYTSPDARHVVHARVDDAGLVGVGASWSAYRSYDPVGPDSVIATRIGPPEPEHCVTAALREAQR